MKKKTLSKEFEVLISEANKSANSTITCDVKFIAWRHNVTFSINKCLQVQYDNQIGLFTHPTVMTFYVFIN